MTVQNNLLLIIIEAKNVYKFIMIYTRGYLLALSFLSKHSGVSCKTKK